MHLTFCVKCVNYAYPYGGFALRKIPATEFCRNFGRYQLEAQREPVAVTSHGHTTGYFVSPVEYAEFQRLRAMARQHLRVGELPEDVVAAIRDSEVDESFDHLNDLLK